MIGELPKSLWIDDKEYPIAWDYFTAMNILTMFTDKWDCDNENEGKIYACLYNLYGEYKDGKWVANIPDNLEEAYKKAVWFLDGGNSVKLKKTNTKSIDFEQDESMIFSAVNIVAGKEVREDKTTHWWTFLGYLQNIPSETMLSTILNLRHKKSKGKMDKYDKELYREYKNLVDIKPKMSDEEKSELEAEKEAVKKLLGG